jgi:hypothetical protein
VAGVSVRGASILRWLRAGVAGVSEGQGLGRWWASTWLGAGWCCARGPEHGFARVPSDHDLSLQPPPAETGRSG